ncbi:hypothetical protein SJAG_00740 [Schizosaccharomyces japonicus yFS275]|uniref:Uncharacterized protein n=1 Tax=Schizosaccharomyces japonicus (strain yFS275 / FY16936) TaxID=402676 RepID=B6JWG4_SCHJY|nr:hypothetical protein SJAG_00740 [Schizosaccharomyces japonicus yFS275]EEB05715.1 hypothetical protein SJAG_00740 [Schizosaccharomyces japonicus yFS275]
MDDLFSSDSSPDPIASSSIERLNLSINHPESSNDHVSVFPKLQDQMKAIRLKRKKVQQSRVRPTKIAKKDSQEQGVGQNEHQELTNEPPNKKNNKGNTSLKTTRKRKLSTQQKSTLTKRKVPIPPESVVPNEAPLASAAPAHQENDEIRNVSSDHVEFDEIKSPQSNYMQDLPSLESSVPTPHKIVWSKQHWKQLNKLIKRFHEENAIIKHFMQFETNFSIQEVNRRLRALIIARQNKQQRERNEN